MASVFPQAEQKAQFSSMLHNALDGQYALVIDARSQREYTEDHLPCAVNLPVVDNEEYAEVGTTHRTDTHRAYVIGVSYALKNGLLDRQDDRVGPLLSARSKDRRGAATLLRHAVPAARRRLSSDARAPVRCTEH